MMSAAMLILASAEQTDVRPTSANPLAGQGTTNDISFAKSFNDRVGEPALLQGKIPAEEATIALPGLKAAIPAKQSDAKAEALDGVKGTVAVQTTFAQHGVKSAAASRAGESPAPAVRGAREKIAASDSRTGNVEPPTAAGADDVGVIPPGSSAPDAVSSTGPTDERLVPPASIADENRPFVSRAGSPAIENETVSVGRPKEGASSKKTVKPHANSTTSPIAQKAVGTGINATSTLTPATVKEGAPLIVQTVEPGVAVSRSGAGKTAEEGTTKAVLGAANASSEVSFATASGSIHKEAGQVSKVLAEDSETAAPSTEGRPASPKSETTVEKTGAAVPAGSDGDGKGQGGAGASTAIVHSIAGAVQVSGTPATALAAGNTSGELTTGKSPLGDAGAHTPGFPVGSSDPDRPGVVTASTNEAPRVLTATPTALEIGIQNGTQGWLKVRAEIADGGAVNATVSAASSAGQEMLHRELPALAAYLQQEKVAVNAIAVHTPLAGGTESRNSTGSDGAGGQTQRGNEGGEQQQNAGRQTLAGPDEAMTYRAPRGFDEDGSLSLATYATGGSWLSVRA